MNKKIAIIMAILLVFSVGSIFAFGIGAQGGANVGRSTTGSAALTFKLDDVPFVFAVTARFGDSMAVGVTADLWMSNANFAGPLNYFYGIGGYGTIVLGDNVAFSGGVRVPLGINMFVLEKFIEPYLMVAPSFGVNLAKGAELFDWFFPVNFGIRFWF